MAKWVQSFRDLPLLLNQWANVVRWELRPRLFLRTSEFLWQEGHTAHASYEEARDYARRIAHEAYADLMVNVLAIPVVLGCKTARERFAGAVNTITLEAMMKDGKALQMGTSHELGQNFSRAFGIDFTSPTGSRELAWTTSWGTSTRMVGGLIMAHGDDEGLRIPPVLAPTQVVVLAVKPEARDVAHRIGRELAAQGVRAVVDDRTDVAFGRRAVDWELKGVPLRVELGPRDIEAQTAILVRRLDGGVRDTAPLADLAGTVPALLQDAQREMLSAATRARDALIRPARSVAEVPELVSEGWARLDWDLLGPSGELELASAGITVRCLQRADGSIPESDAEPGLTAFLARAY